MKTSIPLLYWVLILDRLPVQRIAPNWGAFTLRFVTSTGKPHDLVVHVFRDGFVLIRDGDNTNSGRIENLPPLLADLNLYGVLVGFDGPAGASKKPWWGPIEAIIVDDFSTQAASRFWVSPEIPVHVGTPGVNQGEPASEPSEGLPLDTEGDRTPQSPGLVTPDMCPGYKVSPLRAMTAEEGDMYRSDGKPITTVQDFRLCVEHGHKACRYRTKNRVGKDIPIPMVIDPREWKGEGG